MLNYDLVIIGGGESGLLASIAAREAGVEKVLIIDREEILGGRLNISIDSYFGLDYLRKELTGPEFAQKLINKVKSLNIEIKINTMVLELKEEKKIIAVNGEEGIIEISSRAIIIATGFREFPRGASNILGYKYAGVYTAGAAMQFVIKEGYLPGKEVVIFGSGDIGLLLANRMTIEGAKVKALLEINQNLMGSTSLFNDAINQYNIPFKKGYSILNVTGTDRVEEITIVKIDGDKKNIDGTEEVIECDAIIMAVDVKPEVDLLRKAKIAVDGETEGAQITNNCETIQEGIYAIGNAVYVHDYGDDFTTEAFRAGRNVAKFLNGDNTKSRNIILKEDKGVKYAIPHKISKVDEDFIEIVVRPLAYGEDKELFLYFDGVKTSYGKIERVYPGEKQTIVLEKSFVEAIKNLKEIMVSIE